MQIHKLHAAPRAPNSLDVAKGGSRKAAQGVHDEEDACWEVAEDYPDHLLDRKNPQKQKQQKQQKQLLFPSKSQPTLSTKNTQKQPSLAQPRPPVQHHPATTTILHVKTQSGKNGKSGKKVVEKLRVPMVTNHPPLPSETNNDKHTITTNKFLSHSEKGVSNLQVPNKEYQHSRYADNHERPQHQPNSVGMPNDTGFNVNVHEAIRAAVSTFDNPPPIPPSPTSPLRHMHSPPRYDSHILPHPPTQFLPPLSPPSSHFPPQSPLRENSQYFRPRPVPPPAPPSRNGLIEDVEFEEELLKQRAMKLQEDMERLKVKKTRANFKKFEEDLRSQKQQEFETLEETCKQNLEARLGALFQDKERNMHEYKVFQLDLEEKMNQLLKIQSDLNYKIQALENSYADCAEGYKRECYEVLQRERAHIEDDFARQIAEWNLHPSPSYSSSHPHPSD